MNQIRRGECNHCGWCCQFLMVLRMTVPNRAENLTDDLERFYTLRNGIKGQNGKMRLTVHGFAPCTMHDNDAKRCTTYEERPGACRDFPSSPEQIEGTPCSYYFEIVDDDGHIIDRRGGLDSPHPTPPTFKE